MHFVKILAFCLISLSYVYASSIPFKEPIRVGIAPHSSPRILFESHIHIKLFLEEYFHREVQIVTAKSFAEFTKLANEGKTYDMIITSSHLALLAHEKASYKPLMSYTQGIEIAIVARQKEILKTSKRPLKIFAQGNISLSTLLAQEWLEKQGLEEGRDVMYNYDISASDTLAILLINEEVDIAIMSWPNYMKLHDEQKETIHVLYKSPSLPYNRTYAVKEGNGISHMQWEEALKAFSLSSLGQKHLAVDKLGSFRMMSVEELQNLEPLATKTLKRIHP